VGRPVRWKTVLDEVVVAANDAPVVVALVAAVDEALDGVVAVVCVAVDKSGRSLNCAFAAESVTASRARAFILLDVRAMATTYGDPLSE